MNTVILSFHDDDGQCIEWEAVVDTLDPIYAIIDADDEPPIPIFPGCAPWDSSRCADSTKSSFVVDYGTEEMAALNATEIEATLRAFLAQNYGVNVLSFARLQPEDLSSDLAGSTYHGPPSP